MGKIDKQKLLWNLYKRDFESGSGVVGCVACVLIPISTILGITVFLYLLAFHRSILLGIGIVVLLIAISIVVRDLKIDYEHKLVELQEKADE